MSRLFGSGYLLKLFAACAGHEWPSDTWHILLYHDVPARFAAAFARQVDWAKGHFQVCGLGEGLTLLQAGGLRRPLLTFTFDDADMTTYDVVMPVLSERNVRGCVFAVPEYARRGWFRVRNKVMKAMGWTELREWVQQGHEVGSHTWSHAALPYCTCSRVQQEVTWSKRCLEDALGIAITHFAYPWGAFNGATESFVWHMGLYQSLATCLRGPVLAGCPRFRLRRNQIHPAFSPEEVILRLRAARHFGWVWQFRSRRRYLPPRRERRQWRAPIAEPVTFPVGFAPEDG